MPDTNKEQAIARIKELISLIKSGKATEKDKAELEALKAANPKRGKRRGGKRGEDRKPGNDFAFWNKYPELMDNVAKVAWNRIPGVASRFTPLTGQSIKLDPSSVMSIDYTPTYGCNYSGKGAMTLQFRNIWLEMHRKYRGLGAYEYCDLAIAMLAVIDVFALVASYERIYGVINNYPIRNRAYPDLILRAMHASPALITSLRANLPQFRYSLNRIILQAQRICLPKGFTYLENRIIMNSFIYADSQDQRASSLVFNQESYAKYVDNVTIAEYPAAYLTSIDDPIRTSGTYSELIQKLQELVDVLVANTDVARMCSDLLACYGDAGLQRMAPLGEDWKVSATYDEHMLFKFHNCQFMGKGSPTALKRTTLLPTPMANAFAAAPTNPKPLVTQFNGNIISITAFAESDVTTLISENAYYPGFSRWTGSFSCSSHTPLDTWKENPSIEDVCEGSLWKFNYHSDSVLDSCGTEVITGLAPFIYDSVADSYEPQFLSPQLADDEDAAQLLKDMEGLTAFDWHPFILMTDENSNPEGFIGDCDNITYSLDETTIAQIHDASLLSAFNLTLGSSGSDNLN